VHARSIAHTLLSRAMFSGWGVRTMGDGEGGYNPISYHNGSVWPHENALILHGLARYGLHDDVARLAAGLLDTLAALPEPSFPELFSGFGRDEAPRPIPYPNANQPQAWASGAVLLLVRAILGIEVDAPRRRVSVAPTRVPGVSYLRLTGVRLGGAAASIDVDLSREPPRVRVDGLPDGWQLG
jgi:glycogen debranching enzyme